MIFLIQISICWLVFYSLYFLLLRKETFFRLNRFYLLATVLLSLLIPILEIPVFEEIQFAENANYLQTITISVQEFTNAIVITPENPETTHFWNWMMVLKSIYLIGIGVLSLRFLYGLFQIFKLFKQSEVLQNTDFQLVKTNEQHLPFSFFNLIFINNYNNLSSIDTQKILDHELAHVRQKHSFDVLLLEILCIAFWWNPLVWFYKKSLREVHEFLADEAVLKTNNRKQYGQLLITQSHLGMSVAIGNHFTQSQLKNRIMMMTKSKSKPQKLWKYLFFMPLFSVLLVACQNEITAQVKPVSEENPANVVAVGNKVHPILKENEANKIYEKVDEMPRFPGCDDAKDPCFSKLVDFIVKKIQYPVEAKKGGKEGTVLVEFVVDTDGNLINRKIAKSAGFGMDEEALRLFLKMPKWTPGKKDGKAVKVQMKLPIKFAMAPESSDRADKMEVKKGGDVDEMPYFPGCEAETNLAEKRNCSDMKMLQFVYTNIKYPKEAREADAEGMVVLKFVVSEDGSVEDPKIIRSVHPLCDAEVLRVASEFPVWEPAKKDGKAVAVEFNLPVKFKLEGEKKKDVIKTENTLQLRKFRAYPNPASDKIDVEFEIDSKNYTVTLVDINGTEIFRDEMKNVESCNYHFVDLDISKAAKGAMIISIIDENGKTFYDKVIIQ